MEYTINRTLRYGDAISFHGDVMRLEKRERSVVHNFDTIEAKLCLNLGVYQWSFIESSNYFTTRPAAVKTNIIDVWYTHTTYPRELDMILFMAHYSQGRNGQKPVESCTLCYYFKIWHGVRVRDGDHKNHWLKVGMSLWWPVAAKFKMAATDIIIFHISGLNNHTLKCNTSFYRFSGLVSPFLMSI